MDILYEKCQTTERFMFEIVIFTTTEPFSAKPADTQVASGAAGKERAKDYH